MSKREQLNEYDHDVIYGHQDGIRRVEYLPGGKQLVTGSLDRTIRIWNVADGRQEGSSMVHETVVWDLAVTKDGRRILSSEEDGKITVWDVESRHHIAKWTHQETWPRIAVSPDNDRLVAFGSKIIIIGELYTGRPIISKLGSKIHGHHIRHRIATGGGVNSLSFSPDGRKLACAMDGIIRVHDVDGGQLIFVFMRHEGWVWPILWSQKETRVYSASEDKTICCWNSETGEPIGAPWIGHTDSVYSLSLSTDETTLASGSQDGTIRFWDTHSGQLVGHTLQHEHAPWSIRISPSNDFVASAGSTGKIVLWHVPWLNDIDNQLIDTTRPPTPPALIQPHIMSLLASLSEPERAPQLGPPYKHDQNNQSSSVPLDLTPYIVRLDDRCCEGGSFGDVFKCLYNRRVGAIEVAVKAFRFRFALEEGNNSSDTIKMIRRELGIWKRLDHVNIVPFLGIATGFGMRDSMSLVSAWMPNGSLHRFLATHEERLHAAHRLQVLLDIANGLQYLHSFPISPIVHGDLNGNNVLVDGDFTARLADFGYASVVGNIPEALTYLQRSTSRPGALRWTAPELILYEETSQRTPKSDVYSFGCIMLQVLSGKQPWSEVREDGAIVVRMVRGEKPKRPESRALEDRHWESIQCCWSSVEERPTTGTLATVLEEFLRYCPQSPSLREIFSTA